MHTRAKHGWGEDVHPNVSVAWVQVCARAGTCSTHLRDTTPSKRRQQQQLLLLCSAAGSTHARLPARTAAPNTTAAGGPALGSSRSVKREVRTYESYAYKVYKALESYTPTSLMWAQSVHIPRFTQRSLHESERLGRAYGTEMSLL